jgi:hypothetical protein
MIDDYIVLLLFAAVNLAVLFLRNTFSIGSIIYIVSLVLLYSSFIFLYGFLYNIFLFGWKNLKEVATILYCIASAYCIIKKNNILLLPITFANLFLCHVVIVHTTGGTADMTFSMFFDPYNDERILNTISDTAGIAMVFMGIGVLIFLLVQLLIYVSKKEKIR